MNRREFIVRTSALTGAVALTGMGCMSETSRSPRSAVNSESLYKISLAQWSLHRTIRAGDLDPLDFARVAKQDYGITAVEYVNQFYKEKAKDKAYLTDMKSRADGEGVRSLLIMCDGEGNLGSGHEAERQKAAENHYKWAEAAQFLGCHSIRVNALERENMASYDEQMMLSADGLRRLASFCAELGLNVIVENHGGLSSHGGWLAATMKMVDHPRCGTLPDFGNFCVDGTPSDCQDMYDRYKGVAELMPYAKAVSAKSHDFDENGNDTSTDYERMMRVVLDAGYRGFVGIEYEGNVLSESDGIRATKDLLVRVREKVAAEYGEL